MLLTEKVLVAGTYKCIVKYLNSVAQMKSGGRCAKCLT